jgi:predicted phosphodiesterase
MVYLIFSDVHSNLEALQAFFEVVEEMPHDKLVCLGDLVGYGADPNLVLELVREKTDILLAGNHDYAVCGKIKTTTFNSYAYHAALWTRKVLIYEKKKFLHSLPIYLENDGITWVHSSPFEPEKWHYLTSTKDAIKNFDVLKTNLAFMGHTHSPLVIEETEKDRARIIKGSSIKLSEDLRYLINVGSLGQPRDGDSKPCFVRFDSISRELSFHRFSYLLEETQKKILINELPPFLAQRLSQGL